MSTNDLPQGEWQTGEMSWALQRPLWLFSSGRDSSGGPATRQKPLQIVPRSHPLRSKNFTAHVQQCTAVDLVIHTPGGRSAMYTKLHRGTTLNLHICSCVCPYRLCVPRPKCVSYLLMLEPLDKGARQVVELVTQVSDTEQHFRL